MHTLILYWDHWENKPLAKGKNYWNGDKIKRVEVTHLPSSGEKLHHYSFQLQVAVKMTLSPTRSPIKLLFQVQCINLYNSPGLILCLIVFNVNLNRHKSLTISLLAPKLVWVVVREQFQSCTNNIISAIFWQFHFDFFAENHVHILMDISSVHKSLSI